MHLDGASAASKHWGGLALSSVLTTFTVCARVVSDPPITHPELVVVPGALVALLTTVLGCVAAPEDILRKYWLGILYSVSLLGLLAVAPSAGHWSFLEACAVALIALQTMQLGVGLSASLPQGITDPSSTDVPIQASR